MGGNKLVIWLTLIGLFLALLLVGDGKQSPTEVLVGIGLVTLYTGHFLSGLSFRPLPRFLFFAWIGVLGGLLVLIPFSDSIAYSMSAWLRYLEAYLLFYFFYNHADDRSLQVFSKGLVIFTLLATVVSLLFLIIPSWNQILPTMNLLYATYGHNHLVDLLIFVFPLLLAWYFTRPTWILAAILFISVFGVIFTFARGALALLALYLFGQYLGQKKLGLGLLSVLFVTLLTTSVIFVLLPGKDNLLLPNWWEKQMIKSLPHQDIRIQYWSQAWRAFSHQPLLGRGLGTFSLISKRFQQAPATYSWFAHSFPLEVLAETGIVGAGLIFGLLAGMVFYLVRAARHGKILGKSYTRYLLPLTWGWFLTLGYSFYEYNLNYLLVWLLFWASAGLILGVIFPVISRVRQGPPPSVTVALWLTGGLILVLGVASLTTVTPSSRNVWLWLTAFDTDKATRVLEQEAKLTFRQHQLIRVLHRRNPEVLFALAKRQQKAGSIDQATSYYREALNYDPKNLDYHREYLNFVLEQNLTREVLAEIVNLSRKFLPLSFQAQIDKAEKLTVMAPPAVSLPPLTWSGMTPDQVRLYLAKAYYFWGLAYLDFDPTVTREFWVLARDLNPSLSFYHVELASLYAYKFEDQEGAKQIMENCLAFTTAYRHCSEMQNNFFVKGEDLPPLGFFAQDIWNFPLL